MRSLIPLLLTLIIFITACDAPQEKEIKIKGGAKLIGQIKNLKRGNDIEFDPEVEVKLDGKNLK
jgi:hypothetical protein